MKYWRKAGKYLRNAAGKLIRSLTCCCPILCCDWGALTTGTMVLTINGVTVSIPITFSDLGFGQVIGTGNIDCAVGTHGLVAFGCDPESICEDGRVFWYFQIQMFSDSHPTYGLFLNYQNCPELELDYRGVGSFVVVCDPVYIRWVGEVATDSETPPPPGSICGFPLNWPGTNSVDAVVTVP